jgi:predicted ATPase/DNA-binding winged helix-turn-helix (wHTH) protein
MHFSSHRQALIGTGVDARVLGLLADCSRPGCMPRATNTVLPSVAGGGSDGLGIRMAPTDSDRTLSGIKSQLLRNPSSEFSFGPFRLIPSRQLLLVGNAELHIGARAYEVLLSLLEKSGQVVAKESLIARVWGDIHVDETTLRTAIEDLRRVLREAGTDHSYVTTVAGRGYCFVGEVTLVTGPTGRHGLPTSLSRIIGREEAVASLLGDIARHRLVTVVGPGGIGKTTVAVSVGHAALKGHLVDEAALVDLADAEDADLLPSIIRAALGIATETGDPMADIQAFIAARRFLIVFDSCERIVSAVARVVESILAFAPNAVMLATSREPLRADGERIRRLDQLSTPSDTASVDAKTAIGFAAIELFVERASASLSGFALNDATAPIVADICRTLDGLPLAIELAASRLDAFDLPVLADLLGSHFRLHMLGRTTALPRHRTLAAALDWSFDILTEPEKVVLRRLSIFRGPFTFDAACRIIGSDLVPSGEVEIILAMLTARSLVTAGNACARGRHRLLETTRAYLRHKLDEAAESKTIARRHAEYYKEILDRARVGGILKTTADWEREYGDEVQQIRAALDWLTTPEGDRQLALELTVAALPLWTRLGLGDECLAAVNRVASMKDLPPAPAQRKTLASARASALMNREGKGSEVAAEWCRVIELGVMCDDDSQKLPVIYRQFLDAWCGRRFGECLSLAHGFLATATEADDAVFITEGHRIAGMTRFQLGDFIGARAHIESALREDLLRGRAKGTLHTAFDQHLVAQDQYAVVLMLQGASQQALRIASANANRALSTAYAATLWHTLGAGTCWVALELDQLPTAEGYIEMLLQRTARRGFEASRVVADALAGMLKVRLGKYEHAVIILKPAVQCLNSMYFGWIRHAAQAYLAAALLAAGRTFEALDTVDEALGHCEQTEEMWSYCRFLTIKANILAKIAAPDMASAEALFRRALECSERQGALFWRPDILAGLREIDLTRASNV